MVRFKVRFRVYLLCLHRFCQACCHRHLGSKIHTAYFILQAPGHKISCSLAQTRRAERFLVSSGRAGLQKCWPVPSLIVDNNHKGESKRSETVATLQGLFITRSVPAALDTPNWGPTLSQGPKNQPCYHGFFQLSSTKQIYNH